MRLWIVAAAFVASCFAPVAARALAAPQSCSDDAAWTHAGIGGGGFVSAIMFDPDDDQRWFVGTDASGLFQTCDDGLTWESSTRGLADYYVQAAARASQDPSLTFVASLDGVSRSTDHGATWSTSLELIVATGAHSGKRASFSAVTVDPFDPSVVWAGVGTFRYASGTAGKDDNGDHPHVWRNDASGAAGSWQSLPAIELDGTSAKEGVHTIVPLVDYLPQHPGADLIVVSTTKGVFLAFYAIGAGWTWNDMSSNLPHRDCRDLEIAVDPVGGAIERLFVVLNTNWDQVSSESVYVAPHGGGVWHASSLGGSWSPTSFADGSDGFHLEAGDENACPCCAPCSGCAPKNMQHLALDRDRGFLYVGLNERSTRTEGVWRADLSLPTWTWERMTITKTWTDCSDATRLQNVDFDYFPTIGKVTALAVDPASGDVVFGTPNGAYRCPGGDCEPTIEGGPPGGASSWRAIHNTTEPGDPPTYRANGLEITQALQVASAADAPSTRWIAHSDHGLVRSDDAGSTWRYVGDAYEAPYSSYGNMRNCRGVFRNPAQPNEWFGIFGRWLPPKEYELWTTVDGSPEDHNVWQPLLPPAGSGAQLDLYDVLFLDGTHALVAGATGVYEATKAGGAWTVVLSNAGIPASLGTRAVALAAEPGQGFDRRSVVALASSPGGVGGVVYRDAWGATWQAASHAMGSLELRNVACLEWSSSDDAVVYAGRASTSSQGFGAVLRSVDGGATWLTLPTSDLGLPPQFDVVALAALDVPVSGAMIERLYAAIRPRVEVALDPTWNPTIFGGVFHTDDFGATWVDRNAGLDFGFSASLDRDAIQPYRVHYGTVGNGAWSMQDGHVATSGPAFMSEGGQFTPFPPPNQSPYYCTQQIIHLRNETDAGKRWKERAFIDFALTPIPPGSQVARVELEIEVFNGSNYGTTPVQVRRMNGSAQSLWTNCNALFPSITSTIYAIHSTGWHVNQSKVRFDLDHDAIDDVEAELAGDGVFSVALKLGLEGSNDPPDRIELYNVTGDHRLYVHYSLP